MGGWMDGIRWSRSARSSNPGTKRFSGRRANCHRPCTTDGLQPAGLFVRLLMLSAIPSRHCCQTCHTPHTTLARTQYCEPILTTACVVIAHTHTRARACVHTYTPVVRRNRRLGPAVVAALSSMKKAARESVDRIRAWQDVDVFTHFTDSPQQQRRKKQQKRRGSDGGDGGVALTGVGTRSLQGRRR